MTRRIGSAAALATVLGVALAAGEASAGAAVTIGSNLGAATTFGRACPTLCTYTQQDLPAIVTAPGGLRAPIDGVVVRWRIQIGSSTTPVTLRIVRQPKVLIPAMTGAGTGSSTVTPATNQTSTFDVRLPILIGDRLGIDCCDLSPHYAFADIPGAHAVEWHSTLIDGETARSPSTTIPDADLLVNADIEPDADVDGFGDETQDLCPTDTTTQGPCPVSPTAPTASVRGQRAAALKKCKRTAKKKDWTKKKLRKCKQKANLLPV